MICIQSIDFIKKLILLMAERRINGVAFRIFMSGYCNPAILIDHGEECRLENTKDGIVYRYVLRRDNNEVFLKLLSQEVLWLFILMLIA